MDKIVINGGNPLKGKVTISGAKNAVLPVLAATLLTSGKNIITGAPRVRDVGTMMALIEDLGAEVEPQKGDRLVLDTSSVHKVEARYDLVATMRASCLVLGPLLARRGEARVSLPGGCAIGARPVDLHLKGLEALGAKVTIDQGYIRGTADQLKGARFCFDSITVTGTMNVMMAAALADGKRCSKTQRVNRKWDSWPMCSIARVQRSKALARTRSSFRVCLRSARSNAIFSRIVSKPRPI